jgi:carbonic anhydrase
MSCNAPININNSNSAGTCDLKCDYSFDYKDSNTVLVNNGNHIQMTYDLSPTSPVRYNSDDYQVREVRLYFPSIHKYNNIKADGEILIVHGSGGRNLIVSVPIIVNNTQSKASKFLDLVANYVSQFASNTGETVSLGNSVWNLNDWIPSKKFYSYSGTSPYSPCMDGYEYVVFSKDNGASISISRTSLDKIKKHISVSGISTRENQFFISKGIAKQGFGELDDDIYISCSPTSVSEEQEVIGEGVKSNKEINGDNFFSETKRFMKKTDFLNNPVTTVLLSALVMVGIYKIGKMTFGNRRNVQ